MIQSHKDREIVKDTVTNQRKQDGVIQENNKKRFCTVGMSASAADTLQGLRLRVYN